MAKKLMEITLNDDITMTVEVYVQSGIERQILLKALDSTKASLMKGSDNINLLPICNCDDPNCKTKQMQRFMETATSEQQEEVRKQLIDLMKDKKEITQKEFETRLQRVLSIMQGA